MTTPRQRVARRLVTTLNRHRYPSHQVLDRLEASLRTKEDLEAYAYMLDEIMKFEVHPSLRIMDRLEQCALTHELVSLAHDETDDA